LRLNVRYDASRLEAVPRNAPVLFIANHPYGVLDGLVLAWLASKALPDVKVLANHVLCQAAETRDHLLPVDFTRTEAALRTNVDSRMQAQRAFARAAPSAFSRRARLRPARRPGAALRSTSPGTPSPPSW
jgi:putative hemolysin